MTPRPNAPLGYWLTPVCADIIAKQREESMTFFLGTLGINEVSDTAVEAVRNVAATLALGGKTILDRNHLSVLSAATIETLARAEHEGRFVERTIAAYVCPCGALEIPTNAVEFLKGKTFIVEAAGVRCTRCNNLAPEQSLQKHFFFFKPSSLDFFIRNVEVLPVFYKKEIENLLTQLTETGIPVSKNRETGVMYRDHAVDIEFVLGHLGGLLHEHTTLVATNHVLRQLVTTSLLDIESGTRTVHQLLVLPYLTYPGRKEKWTIEQLIASGHDTRTLRFMLASSLRWDQKDSELEDAVARTEYIRLSRFFSLINSAPRAPVPTLKTITERINHHQCLQGLEQVFKQRGFDYPQLYGI